MAKQVHPDRKQKKKPFQVGPKLAKGAYTGHAQRIKRTLIHKAKVKKQYAKALREEGYATGPNAGGVGGSRGKGKARAGDEETPDVEDEEGPLEDEAAKEEERERLRRRLYGDDDASDDNDQSDDDGDDGPGRTSRFASATKRTRQDTASPSPSPSPEPEFAPPARSRQPLPSQSSAAAAAPRPSKRSRAAPAPSVSKNPAPLPPQPKRTRLSEAEVEKLREKKRQEKREAGRKTARGQPKLGAKMDQLLGKIRRSMA
ncbi:hypothetical protein JCM1841_001701 [Sporobolomyces salmonicolor]